MKTATITPQHLLRNLVGIILCAVALIKTVLADDGVVATTFDESDNAWSSSSTDGIVLPPIEGRSGRIHAMILVHGALVNERYYADICKQVQQASSLNLWVGIPSFIFDTPNPLQVGSAVAGMAKRIAQAADPHNESAALAPTDVIVAGHSLGGVFAPSVVKSGGYAAMVEWGSYVTQGLSIDSLDFPVLTLAGEVDGLTRVTRIALEVAKMLSLPPDEWPMRPVVVLPGVSHSQFCTGKNVSGDNQPAVPLADAQAAISDVTAAFIDSVLLATTDHAAAAAASRRVVSHFDYTKDVVSGFRAARDMELANGAEGSWCATVQLEELLDKVTANETVVSVEKAGNAVSLATKTPSVSKVSSPPAPLARVHVVSFPEYDFNPGDISTHPVSAHKMTCEMMSGDAIQVALGNASAGGHPVVPDVCRRANEAAVAVAERLATTSTLQRYKSIGIPLAMAADVSDSTGPGFLASSLGFEVKNGKATVTSTSLATQTDAHVFPGVYMCQLLSPAKAIEWMMVDSLPKV